MLLKTHLAISLFFALILFTFVSNQLIFLIAVFVSTIIPDIDTRFSGVGKRKIFRPIQFLVEHRGFLHSLIFLFLITLILASFFPGLVFGFFLGYSLHLFADSFTIKGIQPFYPFGKKLRGNLRTGEVIERVFFVIILGLILLLILFHVLTIFKLY